MGHSLTLTFPPTQVSRRFTSSLPAIVPRRYARSFVSPVFGGRGAKRTRVRRDSGIFLKPSRPGYAHAPSKSRFDGNSNFPHDIFHFNETFVIWQELDRCRERGLKLYKSVRFAGSARSEVSPFAVIPYLLFLDQMQRLKFSCSSSIAYPTSSSIIQPINVHDINETFSRKPNGQHFSRLNTYKINLHSESFLSFVFHQCKS